MIGATLATLGVFFLPGILILLRKEIFSPLSVIEKLPLCIAVSLSYWIIAFWWLSLVPLSLGTLIVVTLMATGIVYVALGKHASYSKGFAAYFGSGIVPLFFLFIAVPQVLFFAGQYVPSGQDMSMHTYIATVILQKNAFPMTLMPIVPVDTFGLYPFGFSTVIAVMSRVNTLPPYANALLLTALVHFLFDYSLYLMLRSKFTPTMSVMVAGIVGWTSANPHFFVTWGANPSVLSLSFLFLAVALLLSGASRAWPRFLAMVLVCASFLTNYMFVIAVLYIGLPVIMVLFLKHLRQPSIRMPITISFLTVTVMLLPFVVKFFSMSWSLSETTAAFIRGLHADETARWNGMFSLAGLRQITAMIGDITDRQLLFLSGIAFIFLWKRLPKLSLFIIYTVAWLYFFVANARHWWVPFSSLLYPYRLVLFMLIPISYLLALFFTRLKEKNTWAYILACILFMAISTPRMRVFQYERVAREKNMVTANDLAAMNYLRRISTETDVIWNSYDDAGLWIPAIIQRRITTYHTNPVDMEQLRNTRKELPRYVFVGETNSDETPFSESVALEFPEASTWEYDLVYARGKTKVYQIRRAR